MSFVTNSFSRLNFIFLHLFAKELPKIPPMTIAIWCGSSKPVLHEYLTDLVDELENIISTGLIVNGHHIKIRFGLVISDTPARCMLKGID